MTDELSGYDAIALGELIRSGEISPLELLEATIQSVEKVNSQLNAVIHKMYEQARRVAERLTLHREEVPQAASPFRGVPFLLKDLLAECKGAPFNEGSRAIKGYVSKIDSELVKRLKAGGLNVFGKTNASEFGILPSSETAAHGSTANPWNPRLTAGGSSGGSAAAVASGMVPMAHGNDGGGSIRIPASCCGLFGLKPTRGRNPLGPLFGDMAGGIAHEHAVTRTVRDSAALLDVTSGPDLGDPYCAPPKKQPFLAEVRRDVGRLKIGFLTRIPEGWNEETGLHPDCENAVKDAAHLCETLGHVVVEVDSGRFCHPNLPERFGCIFTCFVGHAVAYWQRELGRAIGQHELEPVTWEIYQESLNTTGSEYLSAVEDIQRLSRKIAHWYHEGDYDMLLSPTMRIPPTKLGAFEATADDPDRWIRTALSFVAFTRAQNITGQPAMSVPLFWNEENVPIGVQFAGRFGDEATLFRLAAQLEQARPWCHKKPRIHCGDEPK